MSDDYEEREEPTWQEQRDFYENQEQREARELKELGFDSPEAFDSAMQNLMEDMDMSHAEAIAAIMRNGPNFYAEAWLRNGPNAGNIIMQNPPTEQPE